MCVLLIDFDYPSLVTNVVFSLQAREALKKYLHYYERWENHARSLKLEEQTLANLKRRINQKVINDTNIAKVN